MKDSDKGGQGSEWIMTMMHGRPERGRGHVRCEVVPAQQEEQQLSAFVPSKRKDKREEDGG